MPAKGSRFIKNGRCSVCNHEQCGRIDYLLVVGDGEPGSGRRALAEKFGLGREALQRHSRRHITAEYRAAVLAGPFRSTADLQELVAEENTSVLQNSRALFNGHRQRWLLAFEAGNDMSMIMHGKLMMEMLWKIGRLTQEIAPPQTLVQNNTVQVFEHPEYITAITALTAALRPYPEARQAAAAVLRSLPEKSDAKLIEAKAE
jgi:hypothetical protein